MVVSAIIGAVGAIGAGILGASSQSSSNKANKKAVKEQNKANRDNWKFTIKENDQLMLVTNNGQLIRCPVNDVRIAGRQTQGVTLFNVSETERVVSVAKLEDNE